MSQYPSPYQVPYTPGYSYDPAAALLAPARRAAILMFVLGGIGLLCGGCLGTFTLFVPMDQIVRQIKLPPNDLQMPPEQIVKFALVISAIMMLAQAIVTIVLAFFVRRGGIGAVATAIVLCALVLLVLAIRAIAMVAQLASGGLSIGEILITIALIALYALLATWLIQAARASSSIRALRLQYQSQYWQQQQQAQMGYGIQQPPPPPPTES
jgi:hypothetical protein